MSEPSVPSTGSVWRCGEVPVDSQFDAVYAPRTRTDRAGMPPAVAAHALTRYCRRGDLVLDPDCGAGTTLTEALRGGRHAVGLTADRRLWEIARANVTAAKRAGAIGDGTVLAGGTAVLSGIGGAGLIGRVALVLTTIRSRPGSGPASTTAVDNLADTLSRCVPLLRPGGHVVITARPHRVDDELVDLPGLILTAGRGAGLRPAQRRAALVARTTLSRVAPKNRRPRDGRLRVMRVAHHDIVVLRAPDRPALAAARLPRELRTGRLLHDLECAELLRCAA
ncbi:DNA methyltransferase [Kutzneria sp. NPDC051319]|uniref:DNA methyltransferase n=1 Tax=Kutzneria sp. NPDC051319 TaxID=3155047 RepID=UPI003423E90D